MSSKYQIGATLPEIVRFALIDYNLLQYMLMEYRRIYEELQVMIRESRMESTIRDHNDSKVHVVRDFLRFCYNLPEYNQSGYRYPDLDQIDIGSNCIELLCYINEKIFQLKYQSGVIQQFIQDVENNSVVCYSLMNRFGDKLYLSAIL